MTESQKHFVAVIAGEAIGGCTRCAGCNGSNRVREQKAVAHTIMNRVNEPRDVWRRATSVSEVLVHAQYKAVGTPEYNKAMEYMNSRDLNNLDPNNDYEILIAAVIPIYNGEVEDFTNGAHYIFVAQKSAEFEKGLLKQPNRYKRVGPFQDVCDESFRMYRCEW